MAIRIDDIVSVTASVRASVPARREFGRTLFLTRDSSYLWASGVGKVQRFTKLSDVEDAFGEDSDVYSAARAYFLQSPKSLLIGRWAQAADDSGLFGSVPGTVLQIADVNDGAFSVGGESVEEFTGLNFGSAATFADVATVLQTALRASSDARFSGATVEYSGTRQGFEVGFPSKGRVSQLLPPTSGTDVSSLLGLSVASGAVYVQGGEAETVTAALAAIADVDDSFYFVATEEALNDTDTVIDISQWVNARKLLLGVESNAEGVLTAGEAVSVPARLVGAGRTFSVWTRFQDYKVMSILGRLSRVDYDAAASVVTAKFKTLPGTAADELTSSQKAELDRKRVNMYVSYGGSPIFVEGVTAEAGGWIDVRAWIDWFSDTVQGEVFNLLVASPKVPQTVAGIALIKETIERVCRTGLRNGGIAPGVVSDTLLAEIRSVTEDSEFDGDLSTGYLVYSAPLAMQSQADREARMSPPFNVWVKGSGAVHFVDISVIFEQ